MSGNESELSEGLERLIPNYREERVEVTVMWASEPIASFPKGHSDWEIPTHTVPDHSLGALCSISFSSTFLP